jgi:hypothetical protein
MFRGRFTYLGGVLCKSLSLGDNVGSDEKEEKGPW